MARYHKEQFRQDYADGMIKVQRVFYENNLEHNFVNLRNLKNEYKLLIVPGHIIMEESVTKTLREFVANGGTVIMTGYSALADGNGRVYTCPHPGELADVFGIRVAGLRRTDMACFFEENPKTVSKNGVERELIRVTGVWDEISDENANKPTDELGEEFYVDIDCYEELELTSARSVARYADKDMCAISVNTYGKGKAYYIAAETNYEMLHWLIDKVSQEIDLGEKIVLPHGVQGRRIADGQYFYVNMNRHRVTFELNCPGKGILTEQNYEKRLVLEGYQCELIVCE